jgi:hypothetical protein
MTVHRCCHSKASLSHLLFRNCESSTGVCTVARTLSLQNVRLVGYNEKLKENERQQHTLTWYSTSRHLSATASALGMQGANNHDPWVENRALLPPPPPRTGGCRGGGTPRLDCLTASCSTVRRMDRRTSLERPVASACMPARVPPPSPSLSVSLPAPESPRGRYASSGRVMWPKVRWSTLTTAVTPPASHHRLQVRPNRHHASEILATGAGRRSRAIHY